uniref:Dynein cytoplasmic 2 heavy chain 1 n=1 Tax=Macrostomum lignano TaxID=282301 RepID=A0A1I8GH67_9PLAT
MQSLPELSQELRFEDANLWRDFSRSSECENAFPLEKRLSAFQKVLAIQALRPDRLFTALNQFAMAALDLNEISPPNVNLKVLFEKETSATEPVLVLISAGSDPSQELQELAGQTIGSENYHQVAMGQGQSEIALKLLRDCSREGDWLCLKNLHLVTSWLPVLEKELNQLRPHAQFRLWLTAEPHPKFPPILLQTSLKVTYEAPPGVKRNLSRTYETWTPQFMSLQGSVVRSCTLFALAWFHAVLQERRNFIPQGWTKFYEFSNADLRAGADIIDRLVKKHQDAIPWEFVYGLFENAIYGGRVDNVFDLRVLKSYLHQCFDPNNLTKGNRRLGPIKVPGTTNHREFVDAVATLPEFDNPSYFGLPENIDRSSQRILSSQVIGQLRVLQRVDVKGVKFDKDLWAQELSPILNLWKKLNQGHQLIQAKANPPSHSDSANPIKTFVLLERFNAIKLVQYVHSSLASLSKVIRGSQLLTSDIQKLAEALLLGETPLNWLSRWDGPEDPLLYLHGLVGRAVALDTWLDKVMNENLLNSPLDLSELFKPDTFLNALRQQTARQAGCSMDSLKFACSWGRGGIGQAKLTAQLVGFQLEGCTFDGNQLTENSRDSPSVSAVPAVTIAWIAKTSSDVYSPDQCISLPVYYDQNRDRVVARLDLPCNSGTQDQWIQCGAALFLKPHRRNAECTPVPSSSTSCTGCEQCGSVRMLRPANRSRGKIRPALDREGRFGDSFDAQLEGAASTYFFVLEAELSRPPPGATPRRSNSPVERGARKIVRAAQAAFFTLDGLRPTVFSRFGLPRSLRVMCRSTFCFSSPCDIGRTSAVGSSSSSKSSLHRDGAFSVDEDLKLDHADAVGAVHLDVLGLGPALDHRDHIPVALSAVPAVAGVVVTNLLDEVAVCRGPALALHQHASVGRVGRDALLHGVRHPAVHAVELQRDAWIAIDEAKVDVGVAASTYVQVESADGVDGVEVLAVGGAVLDDLVGRQDVLLAVFLVPLREGHEVVNVLASAGETTVAIANEAGVVIGLGDVAQTGIQAQHILLSREHRTIFVEHGKVKQCKTAGPDQRDDCVEDDVEDNEPGPGCAAPVQKCSIHRVPNELGDSFGQRHLALHAPNVGAEEFAGLFCHLTVHAGAGSRRDDAAGAARLLVKGARLLVLGGSAAAAIVVLHGQQFVGFLLNFAQSMQLRLEMSSSAPSISLMCPSEQPHLSKMDLMAFCSSSSVFFTASCLPAESTRASFTAAIFRSSSARIFSRSFSSSLSSSINLPDAPLRFFGLLAVRAVLQPALLGLLLPLFASVGLASHELAQLVVVIDEALQIALLVLVLHLVFLILLAQGDDFVVAVVALLRSSYRDFSVRIFSISSRRREFSPVFECLAPLVQSFGPLLAGLLGVAAALLLHGLVVALRLADVGVQAGDIAALQLDLLVEIVLLLGELAESVQRLLVGLLVLLALGLVQIRPDLLVILLQMISIILINKRGLLLPAQRVLRLHNVFPAVIFQYAVLVLQPLVFFLQQGVIETGENGRRGTGPPGSVSSAQLKETKQQQFSQIESLRESNGAVSDCFMRIGFVLGEQHAVAGTPRLVDVPADELQVSDVVPAAEDGLALPDVVHQVFQVGLLDKQRLAALLLAQQPQHTLEGRLIFAGAGDVVLGEASAALANLIRLNAQWKLCTLEVAAAGGAVMNIVAQLRRVLGHSEQVGVLQYCRNSVLMRFRRPDSLSSATPRISRSASRSISSMRSRVSLHSCSFTVCFSVSKTSNRSSCVRVNGVSISNSLPSPLRHFLGAAAFFRRLCTAFSLFSLLESSWCRSTAAISSVSWSSSWHKAAFRSAPVRVALMRSSSSRRHCSRVLWTPGFVICVLVALLVCCVWCFDSTVCVSRLNTGTRLGGFGFGFSRHADRDDVTAASSGAASRLCGGWKSQRPTVRTSALDLEGDSFVCINSEVGHCERHGNCQHLIGGRQHKSKCCQLLQVCLSGRWRKWLRPGLPLLLACLILLFLGFLRPILFDLLHSRCCLCLIFLALSFSATVLFYSSFLLLHLFRLFLRFTFNIVLRLSCLFPAFLFVLFITQTAADLLRRRTTNFSLI